MALLVPLKAEAITVPEYKTIQRSEVVATYPVIQVKAKPETPEQIIRRVSKERGFKEVETLIRIAKCESGLRPTAQNPTSSAHGVFQILKHRQNYTIEQREDVEWSTHWSIDNYNNGHPWDTSKHCWSIEKST